MINIRQQINMRLKEFLDSNVCMCCGSPQADPTFTNPQDDYWEVCLPDQAEFYSCPQCRHQVNQAVGIAIMLLGSEA